MSVHDLTQVHRAQQLLIRRDTASKVERIWPALDYNRLDETFPLLAARIATVVRANRQLSAGVAARYTRALRRAHAIPGDAHILAPATVSAALLVASLRATSVAGVKAATALGVPADVAMSNALVRTSGAASRHVLNAGRETVRATSVADPECQGWVRVGHGECDWCQQYLDGEIHKTEGYDFDAHDHCGCTAEPVYG